MAQDHDGSGPLCGALFFAGEPPALRNRDAEHLGQIRTGATDRNELGNVAPTRGELTDQLRDWNGQFDCRGEVVDVEFLTEQWRRLYRECLGKWPS